MNKLNGLLNYQCWAGPLVRNCRLPILLAKLRT